MELVSDAIAFAVKAHDGMRRKKSDAPYILHPMEAAVIVGTMTDSQEVIASAILHDVVEDTDTTIEEIEARFGKRVKELVSSETEDKRADLPPEETWRIRKEESLNALADTDDLDVLKLWLGDKLSNMRSIYRDWKVEGDSLWQRFNQKDKNEHYWYYQSIANCLSELKPHQAYKEYCDLIKKTFTEEK